MNKIYRFTLFNSNPYGNGGDKRTAQISELLAANDLEYQIIPSGFNPMSFSFYDLRKCIKATAYFIKVLFIIRRVCHPRSMFRTIRLVTQYKGVFSIPKAEKSQVILWESTKTDFSFVVPLFLKKGYRIIAIPHNIESLVPLQISVITRRISPNWLMEEINMLKKCIQVFAISKEDTLLLSQFGVKATYLPYYPTNEIFERLLRIRKIREQRTKIIKHRKKILLLGSAVNAPTREGMINRINFFNQHGNAKYEIIVAGFETEQLESISTDNGDIIFYGELTNEQLFKTLCEIDVLLVHQSATSGALMRVIETLIAGIPVLANFTSARNYYGTDGVFVYNNDEQLINYLSADLPIPLIPDKPVFEYESFLKTVNKSFI